jgi:hypothetical protein
LKRMPACAVTSVNSIGPEGRGGVGLALGEGDGVTAASVCCAVVGTSVFLQDVRIEIVAMNMSARIIRIRETKTPGFLLRANFCVLCVSAVKSANPQLTAKTQRTQSLRRDFY